MNFNKELEKLTTSLEDFDLEVFFHDDTFLDILDNRKLLEQNYDKLSEDEKKQLFYIDEIINGYTNIYARKELSGYAKLSFQTLKKINAISAKRLNQTRMVA